MAYPATKRGGAPSLVRMLRGGQVTLPAETRRSLRLKDGDYLELHVVEGAVQLRPVTILDHGEADRQLDAILRQVRRPGGEQALSDEEIMDMAAEEIHELRLEHATSGSR